MTQTNSASTTRRRPRPPTGKKKAATKKKPEKAEAAPEEPAEEPEEEESPSEEAAEAKPSARRVVAVVKQSPAIVRTVVESNELASKVCALEPERTPTEVFTSLDEAATELGEDPVNVESAMRLLAGLGVCTFVVGRRGRPTRAIWLVGNIADVIVGDADEYTEPERASGGPINRPLSTTAKLQISAAQRTALCKELGIDNLDRAALKKWAEDLLISAVKMVEDGENEE